MPALNVRMPDDIYQNTRELAQRQGVSLNTYILEKLEQGNRTARDQELFDAASLLADDAAECDVEFAIYAQQEVMLSDE